MSPDGVMSEVVQPLCAFHWGYTIAADGTVTPQWPVSDGLRPWSAAVTLLRAEYPNWTFGGR